MAQSCGPGMGQGRRPYEHGLVRWTSQLAEDATCFVERDRGVRRLVGIVPMVIKDSGIIRRSGGPELIRGVVRLDPDQSGRGPGRPSR
jgi:hypothetical protein